MSGEERQISQRTADAPFGSVNASRLNSHGAVTALLSLMEENGCGPQAMELSYMISAIDNMEKRYSELLSDVQSKREHLAEAIAESYAATEERPDLSIYQEIQREAEHILTRISASKEEITTWAKNTVEDYRQMGESGLNMSLSSLNVRGMVKTLRKQANGAALNIIDLMLQAEKEGRLQSGLIDLIRPIRAFQKKLSHVSNAVHAAIGDVEHLTGSSEAAQKNRTEQAIPKQKKHLEGTPSIRQTLKKNQSEIAANSTPASDKKKGKEAML